MKSPKPAPALCVLAVSLAILASGCSDSRGRLLVMRANFNASGGSHARAIGLYLQALEHPAAAPYAEYGLGLLFFAMEEEAAALGRFAETARLLEVAPEGLHRELRYRNHYNAGVVLFSKGDFDGAASAFREALRVSPGRVEAMRNLELSLMSVERRDDRPAAGAGTEGGATEAMTLMFEYIRQREVEQWRSRDWPEEEYAPGDDR